MASSSPPSFIEDLSKPPPFLRGIPLWIWIFIILCVAIVLIFLTLLFSCICISCRRKRKPIITSSSISADHRDNNNHLLSRPSNANYSSSRPVHFRNQSTAMDRRLLSFSSADVIESGNLVGYCDPETPINIAHGRSSSGVVLKRFGSISCGCEEFSLAEIEEATSRFAEKNVIGVGPHGIVYRGVLLDGRRVAVKRFLNNCIQFEEFKMQVQTMQILTHKNLVKIIGFCVDTDNRMLVNEYVDNGNLHHWLHGYYGGNMITTTLTWENRMEIIFGIAKVLAYFHEDVEPNLTHQGIKSTNILLDRQWNPKISDFGQPSLLPQSAPTYTYTSPASSSSEVPSYTNNISEKADDVYSFGVLVMEIISGRKPAVKYSNREDVCLLRWLKSMVSDDMHEQVLDLKVRDSPPAMKELKRVILIALRCADPCEDRRPKMSEVIHMLEPRDLLLCDEPETGLEVYRRTGSGGTLKAMSDSTRCSSPEDCNRV